MLRISTKGRYAIRAMLDIAHHSEGSFVSLRNVSARQNISVRYLELVVVPLLKAKLLESHRGKIGGYRLTRPAANYTLLEILNCAEGSLAPVVCLMKAEQNCVLAPQCTLLPIWKGFYDLTNDYFESFSLEDLMISGQIMDFSKCGS